MTGLVQRCAACGAEMVVESRHRGRTVSCSACGATFEVPKNIDFVALESATARDRDRAGWLLCATIVAGIGCCVPASALIWWSASGAVRRAREADRAVEPLLASTAAVAKVFTIIDLVAWLIAIAVYGL